MRMSLRDMMLIFTTCVLAAFMYSKFDAYRLEEDRNASLVAKMREEGMILPDYNVSTMMEQKIKVLGVSIEKQQQRIDHLDVERPIQRLVRLRADRFQVNEKGWIWVSPGPVSKGSMFSWLFYVPDTESLELVVTCTVDPAVVIDDSSELDFEHRFPVQSGRSFAYLDWNPNIKLAKGDDPLNCYARHLPEPLIDCLNLRKLQNAEFTAQRQLKDSDVNRVQISFNHNGSKKSLLDCDVSNTTSETENVARQRALWRVREMQSYLSAKPLYLAGIPTNLFPLDREKAEERWAKYGNNRQPKPVDPNKEAIQLLEMASQGILVTVSLERRIEDGK